MPFPSVGCLAGRRVLWSVAKITMSNVARVLKGPPVKFIPKCSLGEYLLPRIKSLPQDRIVQVEGETGATQTVAQMLEMAIRVSEGLRKLGLKAGDPIGMFCLNCFDTTSIVLGSWLSATVIAPLPVGMTVGEMKYFLQILESKYIFCEEEVAKNLAAAVDALAIPATIIVMANTFDEKPLQQYRGITWKLFRDILPEVNVGSYVPGSVKSPSTAVVTVLFSSGTTGLPKGVGITHKNLIFQDINLKTTPEFPVRLNHLLMSQFFWVTAHSLLLCTLTSGMLRVLFKRPTPDSILKAMEEHKVQWSLMTPSLVIALGNYPDFEKYNFSSLEALLVGGSILTPTMLDKMKAKWKNIRIEQCYGSTELAGMISFTGGGHDVYSLGKVTLGCELKITDPETGKLQKANVLGKICVRSPGLMKGYIKNEVETKAAIDKDGWFNTGDLGYYNESELLYYVDRFTDFIKVKGMQVSPAEVENVILQVPGVIEAAVVGVLVDDDLYELMGFVVKEKDSAVTEQIIQNHVAETLSNYKHLTAGVVFVESLPKTLNGKILRKDIRKTAQELYESRQKENKE